MSKSFSFDEKVAQEFGVEEAILIRSFQFWIDLNKANGRNLREGRTWTFNTYASIAEMFSFWDESKVRRLVDKLIKSKVLIKTCKFNRYNIDKTNWYAFEDESRWLTVKEASEKPLTNSSDEENLFNQNEPKSVNSAAGTENSENIRLTKTSDGKVDLENLEYKTIDEISSSTDENISRLTDSTDLGLTKTTDSHLTKTSDQYQLLNSSLQVAEEEEKKEPVNTFELLFNKTAIKAYIDGTCEKLAFDFNNIELVNKNIERLFRMFAGVDQPNQIHVDQIRNELLNDSRMELSYKVCWVIIQLAFMEYPGTEKKYQNVNSLLRRIGWKKDDFAKDLPTYRKQQETYLARQKQKEIEHKTKEQEFAQMLEWTKTKLAEHDNILTAAEVNEINKFLKANKIMDANGTLQHYLYDVHKLNEAAA